jgi:hypothetical protein
MPKAVSTPRGPASSRLPGISNAAASEYGQGRGRRRPRSRSHHVPTIDSAMPRQPLLYVASPEPTTHSSGASKRFRPNYEQKADVSRHTLGRRAAKVGTLAAAGTRLDDRDAVHSGS